MKTLLGSLWLALGLISTCAHDAYEITSVAYVYSDRIEVTLEMEFPTALKLVGLTPQPDVAVARQFETALPRLHAAAGAFLEFTAAHHRPTATATNVELGQEAHVILKLSYSPATQRPLRFRVPGLKMFGPEPPYGATLTVLDMAQQKVLGQVTLFDSGAEVNFPPSAELPANQPVLPGSEPDRPAVEPATPRPATLPAPPASAAQPGWRLVLVLFMALGCAGGWWWWWRR